MTAARSRPLPFALRSLAAALALSAPIGAAWAQSLEELYDAARSYDATYLAARSVTESLVYRAAQAEAGLRPQLSLAANATRTEATVPVLNHVYQNATQVGFNGRQPLYNKPNKVAIDQAYKTVDAGQTDLQAAEQDLIVRVSQAYFDVLGARDTLGYSQTSKAAIAEQLAAAKRNFEVGTATITDTREAQARYDLANAQEIAAQNDLETKRAALDQLVGRLNVEPKALAAGVDFTPLFTGSVDDWLRLGDEQHPSVRKARLALEIARLETEKAKAAALPTVDLVGSLASANNNGSGINSGFPGVTNSASLGVQLNLALFAGYSIQNREKETVVLEEKARNDLDAARRGVALGTRQFYLGVRSGQAQVKAFEAAESSNQLALEATELGYKVGVRVNLDVLNAQTQLFQTRRDLARARYDLLVNSLKLRQASGQLKAEDLLPVNALLVR
jgi:outer membrane protein